MTIQELKRVGEVLNSEHILAVEVGYEYEANGIRYYSAVTKETNIPHLYNVRVQIWEGIRIIKCNCPAAAKEKLCRHAIAVGKLDTARTGFPAFLPALLTYKAHIAKRCAVCDDREVLSGNKCRQCASTAVDILNAPYFSGGYTKERKSEVLGGVRIS